MTLEKLTLVIHIVGSTGVLRMLRYVDYHFKQGTTKPHVPGEHLARLC